MNSNKISALRITSVFGRKPAGSLKLKVSPPEVQFSSYKSSFSLSV